MLSKNLLLILKRAGLAFSLLFSFVVLSAVDANAQGRGKSKDKYEKQRAKIEQKREKFEEKYERKRERLEDRRDRREDRDDRYDDDYRDRRDSGYYRNNGNGNTGYQTMYETARRHGYEDGLRAGADDARDGDRYNPQGHSDFRRATDGYDNRYGNRGQYQQAYRDAFVQAYREAYSRNTRNRNGRWGF